MAKRKRKEAGEGAQFEIPNGGVDPRKKAESKNGGAVRGSGKEEQKEGYFLLGDPTFVDLGNGRVRCVESGHELLAKDQEAYGRSKACRLALIDAAVARKKPPLNMFAPHPTSKSQLVCKLTGDHVNKAEEHIWKHMSGKKFQKRLEQKEVEKHANAAVGEKEKKQSRKEHKEMEKHAGAVVEETDKKQSKRERKGMEKHAITEIVEKDKKQLKSDLGASRKDQVKNTHGNQRPSKKIKPNNGDDEEPHFWEPPPGSRWDFDDGKVRWDSNTNSADEADDDGTPEKDDSETGEPIKKSKQKKSAVRPVDLASKKKKEEEDFEVH
ncbi:surfeit locus protein 2-like [Zingiber officinale]|uniref:surfeit locus protein 2-like n=1 Tax=Zingiber officinale TaxID=94328 RepID=UPI001C4BA84B|nr:surfeit locus protein 2-like [Zingiber officinale]